MSLRSAIVSARRSYIRRAPPPTSKEVADLLAKYASSPAPPLNLSTLLSFGRPLTQSSVLSSVSHALAEIPRRLALRVRRLEALPFIVGTNPYVANVAFLSFIDVILAQLEADPQRVPGEPAAAGHILPHNNSRAERRLCCGARRFGSKGAL